MSSSPPSRIPLRRALFYIFLSVIIVSGSSLVGLIYYHRLKENRRSDPNNRIMAIVQTSNESEELKTVYLAELLGLSIDYSMNLYAFNSKEALKKLLEVPVVKEAKIIKIHPGTIWVDYSLRKPIAILGDFSNTMIDREGIPFPIQPFFTPKRLPEIYLGRIDEEGPDEPGIERKFSWGTPISGKRLRLAFELLDFFNQYCCPDNTHLHRIDVSKAFSLSCGQRQVILILEDSCEKEVNGKHILCIYPKILRLDFDNYEQQLHRYISLRSYLHQKYLPPSSTYDQNIFQANPVIIDLRINDLAFINF